METQRFPAGTQAVCNRCGKASATDRDTEGIVENDRVYRLQSMSILQCGHLDCHWVKRATIASGAGH